MQVPSWLVSFIIAFVLGGLWNAIQASCAVHTCPWPL